ncbi:uncharacterized protein [Clytia hemisphaerica]|uniref:uncharacterized protein n=1 Tax=Clytia hemisphaerica TaxID=252671 RepID=UPI0034D6B781
MRKFVIEHSIKIGVNKFIKPIRDKLNHKLDLMIKERDRLNGISKNPNTIITNLSSHTLSEDEYKTLRFGLNHGLAKQPKDTETFVVAEELWNQLYRSKVLKNGHYSVERAKNLLRGFAFNYINIDDRQIFKDSKHIKLIKNLRKSIAILKPDKGNGIVLIDIADYQYSIDSLFADKAKFRKVNVDPTASRLTSIQRYLKTLLNRNEIDENEYKDMRPKNAKPARAHGLPKIHKKYEHLPKFRPIVDTTGTTHYSVGKYLTNLLNPLTVNDYTLKDSFDAAEKIKQIPKELFDDGYVFVSFDVTSLFTNVPLSKTINIIIDRIYNKNLLQTKISKNTLRKLIQDTCKKTVFSANNILYEQLDGVSMGSSLGPVLANIIMTELEQSVIKPYIDSGIVKFYSRYVDDTLLVIRPVDIDKVHCSLNKFDKNLQFTVDKFEDETPHFLDLEIAPDGLSIFRKDTNTGLYTNFDSYAPWSYRKAWISSLANRATKLCHPAKLKNEINLIKKFASWNGFPRFAVNKIIKTATSPRHSENDNADNTIPTTLWLRIPYAGPTGEQLVSALKRKLKFCLKKDTNVMFRVIYSTHKIGFYTNMKDPTPLKFKSNIVYRFICPGCRASYVGKTERNLFTRCSEHATKKESAVLEHLKECSEVKFITTLLTLGIEKPNFRSIYINLVNDNTSVIDSSDNWSSLLYKEALHIKRLKPILNNGLKASRELYLF